MFYGGFSRNITFTKGLNLIFNQAKSLVFLSFFPRGYSSQTRLFLVPLKGGMGRIFHPPGSARTISGI